MVPFSHLCIYNIQNLFFLSTLLFISADCRGFPPSAGLSFSCWFMICRFSSACESHPVRLLTVVRHMSRAEQQFSCLSVSISATDGCLVISTEEEPYQFLGEHFLFRLLFIYTLGMCYLQYLFYSTDMMEPDEQTPSALPSSVRFKCYKQLIPGQWHHLCLVMAKGIKKSCLATVYLNATAIGTAKVCAGIYIKDSFEWHTVNSLGSESFFQCLANAQQQGCIHLIKNIVIV